MSFYKKHAPNHREHARNLPDLSQYEGMKDQRDEAAIPSAYAREGEEADQGTGTGAGRLDRGQVRHQLLPARQLAALVGHQHLLEAALRRRRPQGGRIRRRVRGGAVRHRLHVPHGHPVRAARDAAHLVALPEVQLRARDRPGRDRSPCATSATSSARPTSPRATTRSPRASPTFCRRARCR